MNLIDRIRCALDDVKIDAVEFERCAIALLVPVYPGLSAIEGGHDLGRDADIYFPFGPDGALRGRLMATTGDARANVAQGLKRMREEQLSVDLVVVACSRPLSATQRRSIGDLCDGYGVGDAHFYARDWLVAHLAERPEWREKLLHITGELGSLLRLPLSVVGEPEPAPDLVGRSDDVRALRAVVDGGRDVAVAGAAGVGKTRVVSSLGDDVLFLEPSSPERVIDDLRAHKPTGVIVDDAHDRGDELRLLQRARVQEGLTFRVIATTWPDRVASVATELPGCEVYDLRPLDGKSMNAIIEAVGVTGYHARMLVLRQSEGRAGWALALCHMLRTGKMDEVITGAAFVDHVEGFLRRSTQSAIAVDALACIAALGHVRDHELSELATLVGVALSNLMDALTGVARHGLVEHVRGGWQLQPALRGPLVARWFFRDPPMRSWSTVTRVPGHDRELVRAAMGALALGADAASVVDGWIRSLPDVTDWDPATWALATDYAAMGEAEATWAVDAAARYLGSARSVKTVMNVTLDPTGDAARNLLVSVAEQHLHAGAMRALLDIAAAGMRRQPQDPDDPVRVLGDLACHIDPDFGTETAARRSVVVATAEWIAAEPSDVRWILGAEVIAAALSPHVSGTWQQPGDRFSITFSQGIDTEANLREAATFWDPIDSMLRGSAVPPEAMAHLLGLADRWLHLGSRRVPEQDEANDQQVGVARAGGLTFLASLRPHIAASPALALQANRLIDELGLTEVERFDPEQDVVDLLGVETPWRADDYQKHAQDRRRAIEALADRIAAMEPADAVDRVVELQQAAKLTEGYSGIIWLAQVLKTRMSDPHAWLAEAVRARCAPLVQAALEQVLSQVPEDVRLDNVDAALADPSIREAVVSAAVSATALSPAVLRVIAALHAEDVCILERLFAREDADEVLHALLMHSVPQIRSAAAVSFAIGTKHGPALPDDWQATWEDAVRDMRMEDHDSHSRWRARELLKHLATAQPDLFADWFERRIDEQLTRKFIKEPEPRGCRHSLPLLRSEHRARLARKIASAPRIGESLLTELVGHDRALAEQLLDEGAITTEHLIGAVLGQRNNILVVLGPLLVARGEDPERVAGAAGFITSWVGEESAAHSAAETYFRDLSESADSALRAIALAGQRQQQRQREDAERREADERIREY